MKSPPHLRIFCNPDTKHYTVHKVKLNPEGRILEHTPTGVEGGSLAELAATAASFVDAVERAATQGAERWNPSCP